MSGLLRAQRAHMNINRWGWACIVFGLCLLAASLGCGFLKVIVWGRAISEPEMTNDKITTETNKSNEQSKDDKNTQTQKTADSSKVTVEQRPRPPAIVPGELPALALLLLILGLALLQPGIFKDDTGAVSSLRVLMFGMVSLSLLMFVKVAWNAQSIAELKLDPWWSTLLSTVFAAKAVQSFGERDPPTH